jgi:transposase
LRARLLALASFDEDCRCDATREASRLRAHLVECHPVFERSLGDDVTSPFVLRLPSRYGGPWGIRKAGRAAVTRWASEQKRVPQKTLGRLLDAAWGMDCMPEGAELREELAVPACAERVGSLASARKDAGRRIEALLSEDPAFAALTSMPGVGPKTAAALIIHVDVAAFPDVGRLASYAGIAPRTRQSGTSIKGETPSRCGNRALKSALFLSAFASLRSDGASREYYDKKRMQGKRHNAAVICLARRRLKVMYAMMRDLTPYRAAA